MADLDVYYITILNKARKENKQILPLKSLTTSTLKMARKRKEKLCRSLSALPLGTNLINYFKI